MFKSKIVFYCGFLFVLCVILLNFVTLFLFSLIIPVNSFTDPHVVIKVTDVSICKNDINLTNNIKEICICGSTNMNYSYRTAIIYLKHEDIIVSQGNILINEKSDNFIVCLKPTTDKFFQPGSYEINMIIGRAEIWYMEFLLE